MAREKIVVVADDDEAIRLVLQRALAADGRIAVPVDDGGEIWPILEREDVEAVILDLGMSGMNGWEVLRRFREDATLRARRPGIRLVVVSGRGDAPTKDFALRLGADAFLAKPFDLEQLRAALTPRTP